MSNHAPSQVDAALGAPGSGVFEARVSDVQNPVRERGILHALLVTGTAAVAGLVTDVGFPGVGWWPLAIVGTGLLLLVLRRTGAVLAAWAGFAYGLVFFAPHLEWTGTYVGAGPWLALAALEALFMALLALGLRLLWLLPGRLTWLVPVGAGGLWVAQEALRGRVPFGGFPWGRLAFSQADSPLLGLASVGGAPLVTFVVAASGAALAAAVAPIATARRRPTLLRRATAILTVLALLVPLLALAQQQRGAGVGSAETARIGVVQGNVPLGPMGRAAERRAVLNNHVRLTEQLAASQAGAGLDLVIWPENSSDIDPLQDAAAAAAIQGATDAVGVPLLVGAVLGPWDDGRLRNASMVWRPSGAPPGPGDIYLKRRVVPFGEYIPYRSFFRRITSQVDLIPRDFAGGSSPQPLQIGPAVAAIGICFEVAFDELIRDSVAQGSNLIVIPTNNATFGRSDQSEQQLAMSRLRAVEHGRSVIQSSTTGVSAVIRPDGSVVERTGLFESDVMVQDVALQNGSTLATRYGGAVEWALVGTGLLAAAGAAIGRRLRRR